MTDILFTHSYFLRFDPKEYRAMMPYPPLGTLYAAAVAREAGYSVALFDAMLARREDEIVEHIERHRPRFVVIYDDDFNYLTKMCLTRMREAACRMASIAKRYGATVIVHGSDATDHLEKYFPHGVDYVLCGEGEITLRELLNALTGVTDAQVADIAGVATAGHDGRIVTGPKRTPVHDLDTFPLPARDLIDIDRYRRAWKKRHGYFSLNLATTRGCPFSCNWCAKPLYGQVYNMHSPARTALEMKILKDEYGADHVWICDDIFGLKPEWVRTFADEVTRRDAVLPFKCLSRPDLVIREGISQALLKAGCASVWIGAESGAQSILDAMDKGTTVYQIHKAAAKLRALGIRVGFFLQLGYPGEDGRELALTLDMVKRAMPDEIGISVSYPLPGTKFYERVKMEMGSKRNWTESSDLAMLFRGSYTTEFYRLEQKRIHMFHRMSQAHQAIVKFVDNPKGMSREELRRIVLLPYYTVRYGLLTSATRRLLPPRGRASRSLPVVQAQEA